MFRVLLLSASAILIASAAQAAEEESKREKVLDRVTVIGTTDRKDEIPGSAHIVKKETLERFQYTDVHRALREVPGVVTQEEDGFGLRPNIGIRGGRSSRSADITLMEDGILTGPAPYAAPEAYYFPQMDRMESLEVIKGAGAVRYGPRTTNGVLNMVTKTIPESKQADFLAEYGSFNSFRTQATVGNTVDNVGAMLTATHKQTDGFKDLDFTNGNTGFNVQDVLGKFRITSDPTAEHYQEVELKLGYYDEISDETYLGLTPQDFAANPNRRYGASQLDQMDATAWQSALTHFVELSPNTDLTSSLYYQEVDRTWYRLNGMTLGGVRRDIATIFNDLTANAAYLNALRSANTTGSSFVQRDNAREYFSQGFQTALNTRFNLGSTAHEMEFGARIHKDEEDRFQREDRFDMVNGVATLTARGADGAAGNRIQTATAYSGFVQDKIRYGNLEVTPGLRVEHIQLDRVDYGSNDAARTGVTASRLGNDLAVVIPGVGATYALDENWKLLGGVHKGFAPPGVPNNPAEAAFTSEEKSINYEAGVRYQKENLSGELIGFVNDYENLLGRDSFASGGAGTGDTFNGGKAKVSGVEALAQYDAASLAGLKQGMRLPLTATYTYMHGTFENSFNSSFGEWGNVQSGDEMPYLPNHQLFLSAGLEAEDWGATLSGRYVSEARARAGSGAIPEALRLEPRWVFDAAGEYKLTDNIRAFGTIENLFDDTYVAAYRPAGARPGMPFTAMGGIKVSLW